jgi:hypothetical protein
MASVFQNLLALAFLYFHGARFFLRFSQAVRKFFFTKRRNLRLPTVLTQQHIGSLAVQPTSMSSWSSSFQTLREFFAAQDRGLRVLERPELFPLIGKA